MTKQDMYLNRLLRLARHLGKNHLNEVLFRKPKEYSSKKAGCSIEHFDWALAELPKLEREKWRNDEDGHPYLTSSSKLNALAGAAVFFNLSGDELFHLFVPGYQDPAFMGVPLGENATPNELVNNLYEFIALKVLDEEEHAVNVRIKNMTEKKAIKKFKLKIAA